MVSLSKVMVFVGDVESSASFYERHFGLGRVAATHQPGLFCELVVGPETTLAFHQAFDQNGPMKGPTGNPMNPHKLVFRVPDLGRARSDLLQQGVTMFEMAGEPGSRRCDGLDGEGHRFQLVE